MPFSDISSLGEDVVEEASAHLLPIPDESKLLGYLDCQNIRKLPRKKKANLQTMVPQEISVKEEGDRE